MTITLDARPGQVAPDRMHPAASDVEDALLRWASLNGVARQSPPINDKHRYVIEDARLGPHKTWTRMSGLAKTLDDTTALERWGKDNVTRGYLAHPELLTTNPMDVSDRTVAAGKAGGDYLMARLGTAMHTALERHALGLSTDVPAPYDADLAAIVEALGRHGIVPDPEWIEVAMVYPEVGAAGRLDLCARGPWGDVLRVVDLKTGKLDFGVGAWAAQLSGYARAPWRWTPEGVIEAAPRDIHTGIILHALIGSGTCHVYELDLDQGHEILLHAHKARQIRSGNDSLLVPHTAPNLSGFPTGSNSSEIPNCSSDEPVHIGESLEQVVDDLGARSDAWLQDRLRAIASNDAARLGVSNHWPTGVATAPPWTADERALIEPVISAGEQVAGAPFAPEAPNDDPPAVLHTPEAKPPVVDANVSTTACDALKASFNELPSDRIVAFRGWMKQGIDAGVDWQPKRPEGTAWSLRCYSIVNAVHECLVHLWDDDDPDALTRAALVLVLGDDAVQPAFATGAILGSLTPDEAKSLAQIAVAFSHDDADITQRLGAAVVAA